VIQAIFDFDRRANRLDYRSAAKINRLVKEYLGSGEYKAFRFRW